MRRRYFKADSTADVMKTAATTAQSQIKTLIQTTDDSLREITANFDGLPQDKQDAYNTLQDALGMLEKASRLFGKVTRL